MFIEHTTRKFFELPGWRSLSQISRGQTRPPPPVFVGGVFRGVGSASLFLVPKIHFHADTCLPAPPEVPVALLCGVDHRPLCTLSTAQPCPCQLAGREWQRGPPKGGGDVGTMKAPLLELASSLVAPRTGSCLLLGGPCRINLPPKRERLGSRRSRGVAGAGPSITFPPTPPPCGPATLPGAESQLATVADEYSCGGGATWALLRCEHGTRTCVRAGGLCRHFPTASRDAACNTRRGFRRQQHAGQSSYTRPPPKLHRCPGRRCLRFKAVGA